MINSRRTDLFLRAVAIAFLVCIACARTLWLSARLYPLVPIVPFLAPLPHPFDAIVLGVLVALLIGIALFPRLRVLPVGALVLVALLFLQDESRLWPSFYEFSFFLLAFAATRRKRGGGATQALAISQFILAAVYFWSGALKLTNSFFFSTFPWFLAPITGALPFLTPYVPALGVIAAVAEVLFSVCLLTKRFRRFALWEATAMHLLIFFLIGPFRGNWNDSAWLWGLVTLAFLWILFYKGPDFSLRNMFDRSEPFALAAAIAATIFIGILPALNLFNRWPSSLSFNIYTGNVATGEILIDRATEEALPQPLAPYAVSGTDGLIFDINGWSAASFNANVVPDRQIFLALLHTVCSYAPANASVELLYQEKAGIGIPSRTSIFTCKDS
jgi:hypothetical protein